MCDFHSICVRRDGAIAHVPSNSHSAAVEHCKWRENQPNRDPFFVECEWDGKGKFPTLKELLRSNPEGTDVELTQSQRKAMVEHYLKLKEALTTGKHCAEGGYFHRNEYADVLAAAADNGKLKISMAMLKAMPDLFSQIDQAKLRIETLVELYKDRPTDPSIHAHIVHRGDCPVEVLHEIAMRGDPDLGWHTVAWNRLRRGAAPLPEMPTPVSTRITARVQVAPKRPAPRKGGINSARRFLESFREEKQRFSRQTNRHFWRSVIGLAIRAGMKFSKADLEWLNSNTAAEVDDYIYAFALTHERGSNLNLSFAKAFEAQHKQAPYLEYSDDRCGRRLYVGAEFKWKGDLVKVTSMSRDSLTACHYPEPRIKGLRKGGIACFNHQRMGHEYRNIIDVQRNGKTLTLTLDANKVDDPWDNKTRTPDRRYTITVADLQAERDRQLKLARKAIQLIESTTTKEELGTVNQTPTIKSLRKCWPWVVDTAKEAFRIQSMKHG